MNDLFGLFFFAVLAGFFIYVVTSEHESAKHRSWEKCQLSCSNKNQKTKMEMVWPFECTCYGFEMPDSYLQKK